MILFLVIRAARTITSGLLVIVCFMTAACSSDPPSYPIEGKIVFKGKTGNARQLSGGYIRFQSMTDASLTAVGEIDDQGAFSMSARFKDKYLSGVPAGEYKARVDPPVDDDTRKPRRGLIHEKFEDFDKSGFKFSVPGSENIQFTVHR